MKIYIGSDHAGYALKEKLKEYLSGLGYEVTDKGAVSFDANDDYPDFVTPVALAVAEDWKNGDISRSSKTSRGIVIGGTGQGEAICANKVKGIRAALFYGPALAKDAVDIGGRQSTDPYEIVTLARLHNNANVLALSSRFLSDDEAKQAVKVFLETPFSNDERHVRRLSKFD